MLFLTRAAVCIGLVAVAASGTGGGGAATTLDRHAGEAATRLGQACLASRDCLRIGSGLAAGALPLLGRLGAAAPGGAGTLPRQPSAAPQRVRVASGGHAKPPRPHRSAPPAP